MCTLALLALSPTVPGEEPFPAGIDPKGEYAQGAKEALRKLKKK
jgi:hypothetical protein